MEKTRKILLPISWAMFALLSILIIVEAATPGDLSSSQSGFLANLVANFLHLFSNIPEEIFLRLEGFLRKAIGHFGLFLFTGSWGMLAFSLSLEERKRFYLLSFVFAFLIGSLLAFGSEGIQLIPALSRSGEFTDSLIDLSGYLVGLLLVWLIVFLIHRKKDAPSKKED